MLRGRAGLKSCRADPWCSPRGEALLRRSERLAAGRGLCCPLLGFCRGCHRPLCGLHINANKVPRAAAMTYPMVAECQDGPLETCWLHVQPLQDAAAVTLTGESGGMDEDRGSEKARRGPWTQPTAGDAGPGF